VQLAIWLTRMDVVTFLTISMLSLSALQIAIVLVHRATQAWPWLLVNALVLISGGLAMMYLPRWAAAISAAVFVPFVLAPAIFGYLAQRHMNMGRPRAAARFADWAAKLHPSAPNRFLARLYRALAANDHERTLANLEDMAASVPAEQRQLIKAVLAARRCDWPGVLACAAGPEIQPKGLKAIVVRALGETGSYETMISTYEADKADLIGYELLYCQLFLLAFAGRVGAVRRLIENQLVSTSSDIKTYWIGIAELNATDGTTRSRARLLELSRSALTEQTRRASRRHVEAPEPRDPAPLSPEARAVVAAIERRLDSEAPMTRLRLRGMLATFALMTLLTVVFALEIVSGGSENARTLVRLGALWPPSVIEDGEWWRLATSVLLHAGWLHFGANMFVLFVLGRFVEAAIGRFWLVAGFAIGGVVSSAAVLAAMLLGITDTAILIGASGAIFALFGIEVARQILTWWRSRDIVDARRVGLLAAIMAIQVAIDVSLPEISLTAHLSGFVTGLVMGFAICRRRAARDDATAPI
jgi:membrane associated rhomboid family serine protease